MILYSIVFEYNNKKYAADFQFCLNIPLRIFHNKKSTAFSARWKLIIKTI